MGRVPALLVHGDAGVAGVGQALQVVPVVPVWTQWSETVEVVDFLGERSDLEVAVLIALAERMLVEVCPSCRLPTSVVATLCS